MENNNDPIVVQIWTANNKFTHLMKLLDDNIQQVVGMVAITCGDSVEAMNLAYKYLEQKAYGCCLVYEENGLSFCYAVHAPKLKHERLGSVNFHVIENIEEVVNMNPVLLN